MLPLCVSREFTTWASNRTSPVVEWLRALSASEHERCGGPGVGADYKWEGNDKVGKGRMEMMESSPSRVFIKLDFLQPFEAHNTAEFTLEPQGDSTNVTWTMDGPAPFISKLMQVFCSMDSLVGKDFETGLANLKTAAEK